MALASEEMRREAVRQTLMRHAGNMQDSSAVARAMLGMYDQMTAHLEPVIGALGVNVLFARALHLTGNAHPWVATAAAYGSGTAALDRIRACFSDQTPDMAADAGYMLLTTFTELLANLIGESLTERLLGGVWAPSARIASEKPS